VVVNWRRIPSAGARQRDGVAEGLRMWSASVRSTARREAIDLDVSFGDIWVEATR
jgi:hypothetical protein